MNERRRKNPERTKERKKSEGQPLEEAIITSLGCRSLVEGEEDLLLPHWPLLFERKKKKK